MALNLSALEGLHEGYVGRYLSIRNQEVTGTVLPVSTFAEFRSDDFKLPVRVGGRLITAGTFFEPKFGQTVLPFDELLKAHKEWEGKDIFKYHDAFWQFIVDPSATPADTVIGRIIQTMVNHEDKAIDYLAEIYDRDIAYKIHTRSIRQISVGFLNDTVEKDGTMFKVDLVPKEASLVFRGKDGQASVEIQDPQFA